MFSSPTPTSGARDEPETLVAPREQARDDEERPEPDREVERRRAEDVPDGEDEARARGSGSRHDLAPRLGAELAREEGDEHDDGPDDERRRNA